MTIRCEHHRYFPPTFPAPSVFLWLFQTFLESTFSGWWFGCHFLFSHSVGKFIIPIDEIIFFRGVAQPPTSFFISISFPHLSPMISCIVWGWRPIPWSACWTSTCRLTKRMVRGVAALVGLALFWEMLRWGNHKMAGQMVGDPNFFRPKYVPGSAWRAPPWRRICDEGWVWTAGPGLGGSDFICKFEAFSLFDLFGNSFFSRDELKDPFSQWCSSMLSTSWGTLSHAWGVAQLKAWVQG